MAFDLLLVLLVIVHALRHALPLGDTLVFALMLSVYAWARARLGLDAAQLQTLVFLLLVFTTQANVYVLRDDARLGAFAPGACWPRPAPPTCCWSARSPAAPR